MAKNKALAGMRSASETINFIHDADRDIRQMAMQFASMRDDHGAGTAGLIADAEKIYGWLKNGESRA